MKISRGEFTLSCLASDQQVERIHAYLSRSYWAAGIPIDIVRRSVAHSLCFGIFHDGEQIALARVVTDRATFAYLCDVYVLEEFRGRGLARWLMESVLGHPDLQGLRRFMLATQDAHGLYAKFGFTPPSKPEALMEIRRTEVYQNGKAGAAN